MERIGKYQILNEIGQGGFGTVYLGKDTVLKRSVAIKTCLSDEEEIRLRFQREAEVVASLQHPNVTIVHDFGTHEGVPYLVQEYLSGEDLTDVIDRRENLPAEIRIDYLIQIARGLQSAHAAGIVHRDVKPGNIRRLDDGSIKVMDFGIAKLNNLQTKLTRTGTMLGTAAYLAPEQLGDGNIDHRCDIFSFGVLAYELLTYERPFHGETISSMLFQILSHPAQPLEERWPDCPSGIAELVHGCLAKEPGDRPQDFEAVIEMLRDPVSVSETIHTERPTLSVQQKAASRPPTMATEIVDKSARHAAAPTTVAPTVAATVAGDRPATEISRAFVPPSRGLLWTAIVVSVVALAGIVFFQSRLRDVESGTDVAALPTSSVTPPASTSSDEDLARVAAADAALEAALDEVESADVEAEPVDTRAPERTATAPEPKAEQPRQVATRQPAARPAATDVTPEPIRPQPAVREPVVDPPAEASRAQPDAEVRSTAPQVVPAPETRPVVQANSPPPTPRRTPDAQPEPATPVDERPGIRQALERYRLAYESMDAEEVQRSWPSLSADQLDKIERSFRSTQSFEMTLANCRIDQNGASATATCSVTREIRPKAGRKLTATSDTTFTLRKQGEQWVIASI